jgi:hypothetical protein
MPARPTAASASSSSPGLLKTPTAQLAVNGGSQHPDKRRAGGHGPTLADQVECGLLPTPTAKLAQDSQTHRSGARTGELLLTGVALKLGKAALLPTPRATDGTHGGPNQRGSSGDLMLPSAVMGLLPTPGAALGLGGQTSRSGDRIGEPLLPTIARQAAEGLLLPTPAAHDSANTPENHLRKKPGRSQVTSLQVIVDYGLLPSGGHMPGPSPSGDASSGAQLPGQLSLDEPESA